MPWSPLTNADGPQRGPRPLSEGLDRVLHGLGAPPADVFTTVRARWADLVGPEAAAALAPAAIEDGNVIVHTASGAWASQARWLEAGLVERAVELFGEAVVTGLVVRVRDGSAPT